LVVVRTPRQVFLTALQEKRDLDMDLPLRVVIIRVGWMVYLL
jgi:hypothetical protein